MHNFVKFPDARRRAAEGNRGQARTIDGAVGVQDFATEAADHFVIDREPRLHE